MICSMSTAMVCAQLGSFRRRVGATDVKRYSNCTLVSPSAGSLQVFQPHGNCEDREGCISAACRASSGGSRRDYEKILARQQKRRVRHMKGVTPSTPDLMSTLDAEKKDQAKLDSFPDPINDKRQRNVHDVDNEGDGGEALQLQVDGGATLSPKMSSASYVAGGNVAGHGREENKEVSDASEGTTGTGAGAGAGAGEISTGGTVEK